MSTYLLFRSAINFYPIKLSKRNKFSCLQLIQGDVTAIQTLDAIIPNKQTYFPDFF